MTAPFLTHVAALPVGSQCHASVLDAAAANKTWVAHVTSIGPPDQPDWREPTIPDRAGRQVSATLVRVASLADIPLIPDQENLDRLVTNACGFTPTHPDAEQFIVVADATSARMFVSFPKDAERIVSPYRTVDLSVEIGTRLPLSYAVLLQKKIGIVGCGSLGSKITAHLARSGVRNFVLVDDDILKPGNLLRHELNADNLGLHKADALKARIQSLVPEANVSVRRVMLGGQESAGITSSVLDELATYDLLIDATANPQAFNFIAAVAVTALLPMVWAEVYAGGIGGFVARLRPNIEPPPLSARQQYLAWCHTQGMPWLDDGHPYGASGIEGHPLIADDADVAVVAAHAARMALDALVRPEASNFPHSAYVIGLSKAWVFGAPYDTRPIDFVPNELWSAQASPERTVEAIEFMTSLLGQIGHEDRTGT